MGIVKPRFKGQDVAVLGFGAEGQAMVSFLVREGARVTVCDEREDLGEPYTKLRGQDIHWQLGPAWLKDVEKFSAIVRSPGVPLHLPALKRAQKNGAEITSLTKIFFERCPAPIIGVTGTKGKGTTVTLIAEMLKASKKSVHLVGNIGLPAIEVLPKVKKTDWVVYELSSFQLQDMTQSPQIAIVLGLTVDHQDYHKSVREYYDAKASILRYQTKNDALIYNIDYPETRRIAKDACGQVFQVSRRQRVERGAYVEGENVVLAISGEATPFIGCDELGLKGDFNTENVMPATIAGALAGAAPEAMKKVLKTFRGLPHRLEPVSEVAGVQFWNNSFGTTPESTTAAIGAFKEPIVLMLGGSDKGQPYDEMGKAIMRSSVKAIVGIGLTAPKMYAAVKQAAKASGQKPPAFVDGGKTMKEMVSAARKFAKPGDVVLLAPGTASFDRFNNYKERGDLFRAAATKK